MNRRGFIGTLVAALAATACHPWDSNPYWEPEPPEHDTNAPAFFRYISGADTLHPKGLSASTSTGSFNLQMSVNGGEWVGVEGPITFNNLYFADGDLISLEHEDHIVLRLVSKEKERHDVSVLCTVQETP